MAETVVQLVVVMGNQWKKYDIVANLPAEVVAIVFGFLEVEQLVACLCVSRTWHQVVRSLRQRETKRAVTTAPSCLPPTPRAQLASVHGGSVGERARLCRTRMNYYRYSVNPSFMA